MTILHSSRATPSLAKSRTPLLPARLRRPALSASDSESQRRARRIAHYQVRIDELEPDKERYSDEVDETLGQQPIGVWERWGNREVDGEIEFEAEIELARMERERKRHVQRLVKAQTGGARPGRNGEGHKGPAETGMYPH